MDDEHKLIARYAARLAAESRNAVSRWFHFLSHASFVAVYCNKFVFIMFIYVIFLEFDKLQAIIKG